MNAVKGKYCNGQIVLNEPITWPNNTEVVVEPVSAQDFEGMREEEWQTDAESIARWIAEFDAIPPLQMTSEEEAEWQSARKARKTYELENWEKGASRIEGLFP